MNYSIYGNHGMVKYCRTSPHLQDNIPSSQNYCLSKAYERDTIPNYKLHIYIYMKLHFLMHDWECNHIIVGSTYIFTHESWGHHWITDVFNPSPDHFHRAPLAIARNLPIDLEQNQDPASWGESVGNSWKCRFVGESLVGMLPSRKLTYPLPRPFWRCFFHLFPVPKVGYVHSLEGIQIIYGFWYLISNHYRNSIMP